MTTPDRIKVAIVEDDDGIRSSLTALIKTAEQFQFLNSYPDVESALKDLPRNWPEVLLMDINLPRLSGIEGVAKIKALRPSLMVIMLTVYADNEKIFQSLKAGANGYLLKQTPPEEILEAIADVHRGGSPMSSPIARKVVDHFQRQAACPEAENLSKRELEILNYLAEGCHNKEIAQKLGISYETVRTHLSRIYEKLHVNSRTEAVLKYLKR
jgi:DNA-binding NarL/FixJ family response regulator